MMPRDLNFMVLNDKFKILIVINYERYYEIIPTYVNILNIDIFKISTHNPLCTDRFYKKKTQYNLKLEFEYISYYFI